MVFEKICTIENFPLYTMQHLLHEQMLHEVCHLNATCYIQIFLKTEDPSGLITTLFT